MKKRHDWSVAIAALILVAVAAAVLWYSRMGPGVRALATPVLAATDEGVWVVRGRGEPELLYRWQSDRHMLQYPARASWHEGATFIDGDQMIGAWDDGTEVRGEQVEMDWSLGTQAFSRDGEDSACLLPEEPEYGPLEDVEGEVPYRAVMRRRWYYWIGERQEVFHVPADATVLQSRSDGHLYSAVWLPDGRLAAVESNRLHSWLLRTIDAPRDAEIYPLEARLEGWAVLSYTAPDTVTRSFLLTDDWQMADYWTQFQHPGLARPHLLDVSGKERMLAYLDEKGRLCIYREREGMADTTVLDESPGLTSLEGAAFSGCSLVLPMPDGGARVYQHYQIYTTRYRDRWHRVDLPGSGT